MRKFSFRSIIILTLVVVVLFMSSATFYFYTLYLKKVIYTESQKNIEFEKSILSTLDILRTQFYYSIDEHDGRIIKTLLERMNEKENIINSYLYNEEGDLLFSLSGDTTQDIPVNWDRLIGSDEEVSIKSFPLSEKPFSRVYFHMHNTPSCFECHPKEKETLGYVVFDVAVSNTAGNITFIRNSSIIFSVVLVLVIIAFVLMVHYRFVRKSLINFTNTIDEINDGNFDARLQIPETKELGLLGKNFNNMLDTFQQTQQELMTFHKKKLRSNYKLATIGEMSARLAHEIRNPLTGIANAIEIIVSESDDLENAPIFEEIQRQTQRVNNAISDLLKYAKKKDSNLEMNNINELIPKLVFFLKNQLKSEDIEFDMILDNHVPLFRFDPAQMEDVLLNLGINAIHAIPKKGSITFATTFSSTERKISISVSDTGKGIPEDDLSRIFHPFFTTRSEGTGLGLAIVKDIIDKHHGEIWADNNTPVGCTFHILLPVE